MYNLHVFVSIGKKELRVVHEAHWMQPSFFIAGTYLIDEAVRTTVFHGQIPKTLSKFK
jgi:hypothetical protein